MEIAKKAFGGTNEYQQAIIELEQLIYSDISQSA